MSKLKPIDTVCVYCGASNAADPDFIQAAATFGKQLADEGIRLVYGGGGVGLMGATARAAHEGGGRVLGIIPDFLLSKERVLEEVEHVIVENMHQRKMMMFDRSDSFVILPGGIGTLEEVVELLSWRRLDLHAKPVVFYNPRDFWRPLFETFQMTVDEKLTPVGFMETFVSVERIEDVVPALLRSGASEDPVDEVRVARMS